MTAPSTGAQEMSPYQVPCVPVLVRPPSTRSPHNRAEARHLVRNTLAPIRSPSVIRPLRMEAIPLLLNHLGQLRLCRLSVRRYWYLQTAWSCRCRCVGVGMGSH